MHPPIRARVNKSKFLPIRKMAKNHHQSTSVVEFHHHTAVQHMPQQDARTWDLAGRVGGHGTPAYLDHIASCRRASPVSAAELSPYKTSFRSQPRRPCSCPKSGKMRLKKCHNADSMVAPSRTASWTEPGSHESRRHEQDRGAVSRGVIDRNGEL